MTERPHRRHLGEAKPSSVFLWGPKLRESVEATARDLDRVSSASAGGNLTSASAADRGAAPAFPQLEGYVAGTGFEPV